MEENQELQAQEKIINVDIEREMKKVLFGLFHVSYCFPRIAGCSRWTKTGSQKNFIYHV